MPATRWDTELERLCDAIVEAFGRDELTAALTRAYDLVATHTRITNTPPAPGAFEDAVRAELRAC